MFQKKGNIIIVDLKGQIDFWNSNEIKEKIKTEIDKEITAVILDMKDVDFIDSSGAGMLISINKIMQAKQGSMLISSLNEDVAFVLQISKLDFIFNIFENLADALASLEKEHG